MAIGQHAGAAHASQLLAPGLGSDSNVGARRTGSMPMNFAVGGGNMATSSISRSRTRAAAALVLPPGMPALGPIEPIEPEVRPTPAVVSLWCHSVIG
jgi:hypothetical protein